MRFKPHVRIPPRHAILYAIAVADGVYKEYGAEAVVTSLNDGQHSYRSLHWADLAVDLRIWNVPPESRADLRLKIQERLPVDDYDVVLESDHLHIEFQPRRRA